MATEKRLISVDDAMDAFTDECKGYEFSDFFSLHDVDRILDSIPTVDAVEVIRCKDCKFCERDHTLDGGGDEYYYCWHVVMEHGQVRPNEFCCYGERKDND